MPAVLAGFGARDVFHPSGVIRPINWGARGQWNGISPSYATTMYRGSFVTWNSTTGQLQQASNTSLLAGVLAGINYDDSAGRNHFLPYWPGSGGASFTNIVASFYRSDQGGEYEIQADGAVSAANIGDQAPISSVAGGMQSSPWQSNTTLYTAGLTNSGTAQLIITGISLTPGNLIGDAFPILRVKINQSHFGPGNVAAA